MERLGAYRQKRDFARTPEPDTPGAPSSLALRYAVQKHGASRLHFDLRLEWEGALLSWAITRGPSLRIADKRLAVRTEDHPISYLQFEGTIPEGNYGAGTVMLWDIGHWQPLDPVKTGLSKGHLRFALHGQRLTGAWHLIRMKGGKAGGAKRENWLLVKEEDEAAGRRDPVARYRRAVITRRTMREIAADADAQPPPQDGPRPRFRAVQLATLAEDLPEGDDWWYELKFDGYRALVSLGRGGPRLYTRNGHDWTDRFSALPGCFDDLACQSALIDGEVVVGAGIQGFSAMQQALAAGGPFAFYAFDILSLDGADLTDRTAEMRRAALERVFAPVPPLGPVALSPKIEGDAPAHLQAVCEAGGEGLIAKRRSAPYRGGRGMAWLKIKCQRREEFLILGWQPSRSRGRPFASLLLGTHDGDTLVYAGKVGTGFDADTMQDLAARLAPIARKTAPAEVPASESRGARWVTPRLVAEIAYAERTAQGRLRHAVFHGIREDKPARVVQWERPPSTEEESMRIAGIAISNPDRVVFPKAGHTKGDVAAYYAEVAATMLPYCANRPVSLYRLPEGIEGEGFFQRHAGKGFPAALKIVEIAESDGERAPYLYLTTAKGLVAAAQMGTIEFHIWGARRDRLDRPDRMVFDLDPDEGLGWADVTSAAIDLRDRLGDLELPSWALVSGGKGVHVVVELKRTAEWETVKLFSRVMATLMTRDMPDRFTAEMSKARRKGRIFIDWLRNDRSATAIAPFSVRAREGAPVAVPVGWDELAGLKSARAFSLDAARERAKTRFPRPDPVALSAPLIARLERAVGKPNGTVPEPDA
ncbi:DNA ligase D [Pararhodobacter sp. SW119]|uniref:DNA ligase D n=1 Tax=Pararhodobacter sp. SW119 TaxID=2780075 RepID=UPI001ADF2F9C|nr:DNA ligase D [Pararhodobacter sp. SW119]